MDHSNRMQDNCLNVFKLIAALQVMYGHVTRHLEIQTLSWVDTISGMFDGVPIFFTLSGFLIWFSIERTVQRDGCYTQYLRKRFLRIYPEMWVAIFIEIVVMCLLYHGWNVRDTAVFTFTQATIFQFWTPDSLRGYGCGTPNGALWTMGITVQFYIIAWVIYKLLRNKDLRVWIAALIFSLILGKVCETAIHGLHREILSKLYSQTVIRYLWMFLLGMFFARFFDQAIPICKKMWPLFLGLCAVVTILNFDLKVGYHVLRTVLMLTAIVGCAYRFPKCKLKRDLSYGIFIYHMTVVNAMLTFHMTRQVRYFFLAMLLSCLLGYLSTVTIGQYAARKKAMTRG